MHTTRTAGRRRNQVLLLLISALLLAAAGYTWHYLDRPGAPPPRATLIWQSPPVHRSAGPGHTSVGPQELPPA